MTDSHRKWVAVAVGVVALALIGSQLFLGGVGGPTSAPVAVHPESATSPNAGIPNANGIRLDSISVTFKPDVATETRAVVISAIRGTLISYEPRLRTADIRIEPRH